MMVRRAISRPPASTKYTHPPSPGRHHPRIRRSRSVQLNHHRFEPAEIHVPVGTPVILFVTNEDDTAEEFDSSALKVEKVIAAGHYAAIRLRPLGPGRYPFMGEFHADTAQGVVVSE